MPNPYLTQFLTIISLLGLSTESIRADEDDSSPPPVQEFLIQGKLADGHKAMDKLIKASPEDQQARFSLGVVQFLEAVEGLAQEQYRFGLMQTRLRQMPFLRLPVPSNPDPAVISYDSARKMIQQFIDDLSAAEATMSKVNPGNVKLPLHFGRIRLDLDGSEVATDTETLWRIFQILNGAVRQEDGKAFQICFDGGDVAWLRGYCHLLMAMSEIVLAHDWHNAFERTAHLFYPRVDSPYGFLQEEKPGPFGGFNATNFFDVVAMVHLVNFPVSEPKHVRQKRSNLLCLSIRRRVCRSQSCEGIEAANSQTRSSDEL